MTLNTQSEAGGFLASDLAAQLPMICNATDDTLVRNIKSCLARNLPIIGETAIHDGVAVLVGGGPSLVDCVDEIRGLVKAGGRIFALNGAGHWLVKNGIDPHNVVVIDARPHNKRFIEGLPENTRLYLASQCDPCLFDAAKGHDVVTWHQSMGGESGIIEPRKTWMVGVGTSVGMRSLHLVHVLGYRIVHLFGYDSSYRETGHAYPQPENDDERIVEANCGNEIFHGAAWMIRQADDFQHIASWLIADGLNIHVHGDGLLPAVAKEISRPRDPAKAEYDLGCAPAGFDFIPWLVQADMAKRQAGIDAPLKVSFQRGPMQGFRQDTLPVKIAERQRFMDSVMRPALGFVGATEAECSNDASWYGRYTLAPVVDLFKQGVALPKLSASPEARGLVNELLYDTHDRPTRPIVITLREAKHWPQRNSILLNWVSFAIHLEAKGERVIIVRDTEKADERLAGLQTCPAASKDINVRLALYQRAKCNIMTSNGPFVLALFSDAPFLHFEPLDVPDYPCANDDWWQAHQGIKRGEQFPWSRHDQRIVWQPDSYMAIRNAWDNIKPLLKWENAA